MSSGSPLTVGVVGAGVSGLRCATSLARALRPPDRVVLLEWGRGVGGRTAQRRLTRSDGQEVRFDHGCPYFACATDEFRSGALKDWLDGGHAAPLDHGGLYVGVPSSHAPCKAMAEQLEQTPGCEVRLGRHCTSANWDGSQEKWTLSATRRSDGVKETLVCDALALSDKLLVLANQYAVLSDDDAARLTPAVPPLRSRGCVVLLLAFDERLFAEPAPTVLAGADDDVLEVAVREGSKPGRDGGLELWTVRSTASFAEAHLEGEALRDEAAAKAALLSAFASAARTAAASSPALCAVFPWDNAQPSSQVPSTRCSLDAPRLLGVCGDFFAGGVATGVEAAALSGDALARHLARALLSRS